MPKLDWKALEKQDDEAREPAPAGRYILTVASGKWGKSKNGAHPQFAVVIRIDEGPQKGKPLWNYLTFNPESNGAITMARDFLRIINLDFGTWGDLDEKQQEEIVVGRRFEADIRVEEFQGRRSNKIKQLIRPITGPGGGTSGGFTPPAPTAEGGTAVAEPKNPLAPPPV